VRAVAGGRDWTTLDVQYRGRSYGWDPCGLRADELTENLYTRCPTHRLYSVGSSDKNVLEQSTDVF
jgi:hypothetical protein